MQAIKTILSVYKAYAHFTTTTAFRKYIEKLYF